MKLTRSLSPHSKLWRILAAVVGFGVGYNLIYLPGLVETLRHVRPHIISQLSLLLSGAALASILAMFIVHAVRVRSGRGTYRALVTPSLLTVVGLLAGSSVALSTGSFLQISISERAKFYELHTSQILPVALEIDRETKVSVVGDAYEVVKFEVDGSYHRLEVGDKASGWLAQIDSESFLLVQGDGLLLAGALANETDGPSIELSSLPSNLSELLIPETRSHGKPGVRGATFVDGYVLISATDRFDSQDGDPCWVTSLYSARYNQSYLQFQTLFRPNTCPRGHALEILESGGAILGLPNELSSKGLKSPTVLFASGDYRDRPAAQDELADIGSIIEISVVDGSSRIIAKGVRNPQGFALGADGVVWFTEQGPEGGDEVNRLNPPQPDSLQNFGWPIASYGRHYGDRLQPGSPLLNSHIEYGFIEPSYFWVPSIGPAGMSLNPFANDFGGIVVASLGETPKEGDMSLLFLRPASYSDYRLELTDYLYMGERMRDVVCIGDKLVALGDDGAIRIVMKHSP